MNSESVFHLMANKLKRGRQGSSSSQPTKKPFIAPQKEVSSSQPSCQPENLSSMNVKARESAMAPTPKLKGKGGGILKPNSSLTYRGENSSSNGMAFAAVGSY